MAPKPKTTTTAAEPTTTDSKLVKQFKAARRVSTPIIAIETADPAATLATLAGVLNGQAPVCKWDIVQGLSGVNKIGEQFLSQHQLGGDSTINPVEMLMKIEAMPTGSAVFMVNAHRQLGDIAVVQAVWNLRDIYKINRRTLIMLGSSFRLPAEIKDDVVVLDEPLPTRDQLVEIVTQQHKNAALPVPEGEALAQAIDAVVGLPPFAAEQVVAMSLTKNGLDRESLWDRKCKAIEQTPGLSVLNGDKRFADLRGVDNVVAFFQEMIDVRAFSVVVFIDEGDKEFAGAESSHVGDGGVAQDQKKQTLTFMSENRAFGVLLGGLAGTGKTALAQAVGNEAGVPTIVMDLGGAKSSGLGDTEQATRAQFKTIGSIAGDGRVLFIMTANNTSVFSPEINRRFPDQFFFDNPDDAGLDALFTLYGKKFGLTAAQLTRPTGFARGWTGAEVERACERAGMYHRTVVESSRFIVPQATSQRDKIARMREQATGKFLAANYAGTYTGPAEEAASSAASGRSISLD